MYQGNVYDSLVGMFPEWIYLSFYVYLSVGRFVELGKVKVGVLAAGFAGLGLCVLSGWMQFGFGLVVVVTGLFAACDT